MFRPAPSAKGWWRCPGSPRLARYLAALDYARRGPARRPPALRVRGRRAGVVACSCGEPACARVGAHPLAAHGAADATTDPIRLTWWWRRSWEANVGLATGASFDALIVHVFVRRHRPLVGVRPRPRSAGPLVRTGGDTWHFLFAPMGLASQRPWGLARSEWRGWGGWVVAPPSHHPGGAVAAWVFRRPAAEPPAAIRERLEQVGPAEPLTQLVYAQARD